MHHYSCVLESNQSVNNRTLRNKHYVISSWTKKKNGSKEIKACSHLYLKVSVLDFNVLGFTENCGGKNAET